MAESTSYAVCQSRMEQSYLDIVGSSISMTRDSDVLRELKSWL